MISFTKNAGRYQPIKQVAKLAQKRRPDQNYPAMYGGSVSGKDELY